MEMVDDHMMELQYTPSPSKVKNSKRKFDMAVNDCKDGLRETIVKRIILSLTKPSFVLGRGSKMFRAENRARLYSLLSKLLRQQNWSEASGVLSVLLKGTLRDRSPIRNRLKYTVSMELLKHLEGDRVNPTRIKHIYDTWMRKIGSMKHWPIEDRFVVHVEFILFCLTEGNVEDAHQASLCLMQDHEFGSDPMSNMIVGLTFRQLWYCTIPEEMQWRGSDQFITPRQSSELLRYSGGCTVGNSHGADAAYQCNSETSVANDGKVSIDAVNGLPKEVTPVADYNLQKDFTPLMVETQAFYIKSASTENEESFSYHGGNVQYASIFPALEGLDSLLLPLRLPQSIENWEDIINLHGELFNDYFKNAVKHLHLALYSNPPILAALLPLIQLLLIGGQVDKALDELEKICHDSNTTLALRLRAILLEHFGRNNNDELPTYFEHILKKDPTCCHSLAKLVAMHENGHYSPESLLEMIALHLDATFAEYNTWRQYALCLQKLSQYEEDRISVILNGNEGGYQQQLSVNFNKNLKFLTEAKSRKSWRLRCRWWLTRHFSPKILDSEVLAGDLQLLAYKAASACHMYGSEFEYVVKASQFLEKQNDRDLFLFLRTHMQNSIGLFSKF